MSFKQLIIFSLLFSFCALITACPPIGLSGVISTPDGAPPPVQTTDTGTDGAPVGTPDTSPVPIAGYVGTDSLLVELKGDISGFNLAVYEKNTAEHGTSRIFSVSGMTEGLYSIPLERKFSEGFRLQVTVDFATRFGPDRYIKIFTSGGTLIKEFSSAELRDYYQVNGVYDYTYYAEIGAGTNFSANQQHVLNDINFKNQKPSVFLTYTDSPVKIEAYWNGTKIYSLMPVSDAGRYPDIQLPSEGSLVLPLALKASGNLEFRLTFKTLPDLASEFVIYNNSGTVLLSEKPTLLNYDLPNQILTLKKTMEPANLNTEIIQPPVREALDVTNSLKVSVADGFSGKFYIPEFNRDAAEKIWCGFPKDAANSDVTGTLPVSGNRPELVMDFYKRVSKNSNPEMSLKATGPFIYDYANPGNNTHLINFMAVDKLGYVKAFTLAVEVLPFTDKYKPKVYFSTTDKTVDESNNSDQTFTVTIQPVLAHDQNVNIRISGNAATTDYTTTDLPGTGAVRMITVPAGGTASFTVSAVNDDLYPYYSVSGTTISKISNEQVVFSVELPAGVTDCRLPIPSEGEHAAISRRLTIKDDGDELALRIRKTPGKYFDGFEDYYTEGGADTTGLDPRLLTSVKYYYPGWVVEADPDMSENGSNTVIPGQCPDHRGQGAEGTKPIIGLSAKDSDGDVVDIETLFGGTANTFYFQWNFEMAGYGGVFYTTVGADMRPAHIGTDGRFSIAPAAGFMKTLKGTAILDSIDKDITLTLELIDGPDYRLAPQSSIQMEFKNK